MGGVPGEGYLGSAWVLVVFSGAFVALRLYVQTRLSQWFRSRSLALRCFSEGLIIFAWLHFFTQTALDTYLYRLRVFSQREQAVSRQDFITSEEAMHTHEVILQINYAEIILLRNPMYAIKVHMLLFYWTYLIPKSASFYKTYRFLQFASVFVLFTWPLCTLLLALWCQPVSRNWALDDKDLCEAGADRFVFWFTSICHIVSDLMVYFIPIPILRSIRPTVPARKKILAYISFGFGFLCFSFAVAAIIAIAGIIGIIKPTVDLATLFMFTHMEQCWAIMVPCVPAFKVFIRVWQNRRGKSLRTATQPSLVEGRGAVASGSSASQVQPEKDQAKLEQEEIKSNAGCEV